MSRPGSRQGPAIARWLVGAVVPSAMREHILADLDALARSRRSPRLWYWRQALRTLWPPTLVAMYGEATDAEAAWGDATALDLDGRATPRGRGANFLEGLVGDVRRSARSLRRRPVFALTAVATLAIGIGATTAMFSVAYGVALRPLPYDEPGELFSICQRSSTIPPTACVLSPPNAADLARRIPSIEHLGIGRRWGVKVGAGDDADMLSSAIVTPRLLRAFGVRAQRGRLLEDADLIGRPSTVAMISDAYWRTRYGAGDVVGQAIALDGQPVTIIGILPPELEIPHLAEVPIWRPLHLDPLDEANRDWAGFHAFGRARDGHTPESVAREVAALVPELRARHFATVDGFALHTVALDDLVLGSSRRLLVLFLGAVGLLLLVACANVANLMLEQAIARRHEWGIRTALGASPERLVTLQLTESFLIAFGATAAGLGIAVAGVRAFRRLAPPGIPRLDEVSVDATVLLFAIGVAVLTAVLFGVAPALRAAAVNVAHLLRSGGRTSSAARARLSSTLVVAEIAIAMTLVTGAGLLTRGFVAMASWSPGFDPARLVTFSVSTPSDRYPTRTAMGSLWKSIEDELRTIPGVDAVSSASAGPLFGGGDGAVDLHMEGADRPRPAYWFNVAPGFFHAMGIRVVRGREIEERDDVEAAPAAVVNETFVRRYMAGRDPVGRFVAPEWSPGTIGGKVLLVGVVRDVPPFIPGAPVEPQIYWSSRQDPRGFMYLVMRSGRDAADLAPEVRERLRRSDPMLSPSWYQTIRDIERQELRRPLFNMLLLSAFAITALLLAGIGTYALLAYHVSQRDREMGIRMALGAQAREVTALVLRDGLAVAAPGLAIGALGALAAGRAVATFAPGISPADPVILGAAAGVIALVALLACAVPARRAARVAPAITLTGE